MIAQKIILKYLTSVGVALLLCANTSYGQDLKVGYVNYGRLLEKMPSFAQVMASQEAYQDSLTKAFEAKVVAHQDKVQKMTQRFNAGEMTDAEADRVNQQFKQKEQELAKEQQLLEVKVMERRREAMSPMIATALQAIESYSKQNGYGIILDEAAGMLLFNRPEDDLTEVIYEFMKK